MLSPLLFDIFINDFAEGWPKSLGANIHFNSKPFKISLSPSSLPMTWHSLATQLQACRTAWTAS